jgi:hypothetical protein
VETERDSDANLMRVGLGKGRRGREGEALESRRIYPTDVGNTRGRQKIPALLFGWKTFFPNFEGKHPTPS